MLVLLSLLIFPFLYFTYPLSLTTKSLLQIFLFLHTLYLGYLLLLPQPNVFTALNVPLSTPAGRLRALLSDLNGGPLSDHLETLVRRLNELDMRALYVRLGHQVLTCPFCATKTEFLLYAIPQILLAYVLEAAVIGFVCASFSSVHHTQAWVNQKEGIPILRKLLHPTPKQARELMTWGLVSGLMAEVYVTTSAKIAIVPGVNGVMWHDILTQIRLFAFIILPLVTYTALSFSSNSISPSSSATADPQETGQEGEAPKNPSIANLVSVHSHLRFLRLLYPAILRSEKLSERAVKRMEKEKQVGEYAMREQDVRAWLREQHAKIQVQNAVEDDNEVEGAPVGDNAEKEKEEGRQALKALKQTARKTAETLSEAVGL